MQKYQKYVMFQMTAATISAFATTKDSRLGRWRVLLLLAVWMSALSRLHAGTPEEDMAFFEKRIRPLLEEHCYDCHSSDAQEAKGGLKLDTRAGWAKGGESGPALVPGKPDDSLLITAVRRWDKDFQMPPKHPLPPECVNDLIEWVKRGAPDPRVGVTAVAGEAKSASKIDYESGRKHWAFQPVKLVARPAVTDSAWPRNDVDFFTLARMEQASVAPAPDADPRTLIRRATFDLIGLPPSPEEVEAFVAASLESRNAAMENLIDRLLASPRYGERWGRHWLDIARYADTCGNASDYPVPQAYKYRNYVIAAFNADMPFDQFIREQIAGDLLGAASQEERARRVVATGYLATARHFAGGVGEPHLTIDDAIDNVGHAFLGLSLSCARCHDHKFDPVSQADYYALYGVFSSTIFPHPGSEGKNRPEHLVPLATAADLAYAVSEGTPADARIHVRGDPKRLGEVVPRHFPTVLGAQSLDAQGKASGRRELAEAIVAPHNPLTARVLVNRLWQQHFGRGMVTTPNDFGVRGQPPTHPELLDFLAQYFMKSGWSVKAMHRLILCSRTWQLASTGASENPLWAHAERRRLDAESIRDALLLVSGDLDLKPGGEHPFPAVNTWDFTQHKQFFASYDTPQRTVYQMQQRLRRHPFLALFDGADPNSSTASRQTSTTPLQSLFVMNDPFLHERAGNFATRLLRERPDDGTRFDRAFRLLYARPPQPEETQMATDYLALFAAKPLPADQAWQSLARALLAANEFLYLD